jgi:hypothetical protein
MKAVIAVLVALTANARADVDWARGLVTAEGIGIADRHAPNPAVARGTSRRGAEDAAKTQLAKLVLVVPVAAGGTVGDAAKDGAVKTRVARAVEHAIAVAAEPETDGAWRVTMAVPIEALRQAVQGGARAVTNDTAPAVVVVDGATGKPAIAAQPTIWVKALPAWAKNAPHVKAGTVGDPATLYVIVTP